MDQKLKPKYGDHSYFLLHLGGRISLILHNFSEKCVNTNVANGLEHTQMQIKATQHYYLRFCLKKAKPNQTTLD